MTSPIERIQATVADFYGVTVTELLSDRRSRSVVRPRHVAMWLARELTPLSLPSIGAKFNRDHTSVMHAIRQIDSLARDRSDIFPQELYNLRARLASEVSAEIEKAAIENQMQDLLERRIALLFTRLREVVRRDPYAAILALERLTDKLNGADK